ncbi:uncharacterized protein L969DRAFT_42294 [Mixia osmundae IAM 14324]|uniref:ATPase domain-containing protein n=1 Tax=Mixia osmundae (strain CBS 9802 / IAM 14324 / JCM 22182 / KY 12970) TaxID=764103 RepID=G7DTA5_MIXOS|nr:uncharacterized protein L969DRAFT_42294 [Mixia osmundae IAM 14324]KEI42910.1 hypothetical protein L969DRAFT_42294 [Mixia osmundae IAM 14324]GAA93752.1 hypothetical protein E5Q_00398 [Mixia osmundae IAM 14324]
MSFRRVKLRPPSQQTRIGLLIPPPRLNTSTLQWPQRRTFFGLGEIFGVLANPAETVRSLTESKKLLEEARNDMKEQQERAQIPPKHTFSPLPGFFERTNEIKAIERCLAKVPNFTVIFGSSSVGKTALLRQVLSQDKYHVLHFDLRIAGFADLASLYMSFSVQMEQWCTGVAEKLDGYQDYAKEGLAFKHDRLSVERRVEGGGTVKTSDIAHLMELFQSALLKYWEYEPQLSEEQQERRDAQSAESHKKPKTRKVDDGKQETRDDRQPEQQKVMQVDKDTKKIPVFFLDEAHKLPALIKSSETMKCFLDSILVLTKQDRLCHVVHATSDSFYMHWLRQMNVMQHAKIMTIGDCTKEEAKRYYETVLLPDVPAELQSGLDFESQYDAFGGKLAHHQDFVADYRDLDGKLRIRDCSHYVQAHSLLNLQLIHSMPNRRPSAVDGDDPEISSGPMGTGFEIYSPLANAASSPHSTSSPFMGAVQPEQSENDPGAPFSAADLLAIMQKLSESRPPGADPQTKLQGSAAASSSPDSAAWEVPYFPMCRILGARAVDGLVMGRILELRWTGTISPEGSSAAVRGSNPGTVPTLLPTTPIVRLAMHDILTEQAAKK